MANNAAETLIGSVVLVAAAGFLFYAANSADVGVDASRYELVAKFRKAEGIDIGGDVRIAGIKVGNISGMELDTDTYRATVTFAIDNDVKVPEDSEAIITSASLLGDSYISIGPGGSDLMLEPGDEIEITQGSINITDLISKFAGGGTK